MLCVFCDFDAEVGLSWGGSWGVVQDYVEGACVVFLGAVLRVFGAG